MDSRELIFLLLALLPMLLLLKVNIANSLQQERNDLTNQIKGENHRLLHRFKRRWIITTLELQEEDPGPFPKLVGELFNNMSDTISLMYLISGPGVDEDPEIGLFSIEDHRNGKIYVHRPIDRETTSSFMVRFDVVDRSTREVVDKSLFFSIRVSDVNDHAPQFLEEEFSITVKESQEADLPIFQMLTVDLDQENTPNSQVLYSLVSQTPLLKESSFQIDQSSGEIQLSGCLDYETAPLFTLLIRARDLGKPPLSSTATVHVHVQEDNNHRPMFTQDSYKLQIPEGQVSPGVLRLPVQDQDSPFTSAWRAKFNISKGDEEGHFDISTDPETNEGILSVIKPLDYETLPVRKLVISVENEAQLFSCEGGKLRKAVETGVSVTVNVEVTDINDPPAFHPGTLVVSGEEGGRPGLQLGMFNATDPDRISSHISYKLVHDPENWVTVDENSGAVTTRKQTDRESPHVKDSFYTIIVHAIDDGLPPQTGTGTLMLHLSDVNDHAPTLRQTSLHVCASAGRTSLRIDAVDPDLEPNADPFTFELEDGADGTWELGKNWGRSVELLMVRSLPSGNYSVPLRIGDRQGLSQRQTVYVRVCSCPGGVICAQLAANTVGAGLPMGVLTPVCVAFLVLAVALLSLLRCYFAFEAKKPGHWIQSDDTGVQTLIMYNQESKAVSTQVCAGVGDPTLALQVNTAVGRARPGAKDVNAKPPLTAGTSGLLHAAVEILRFRDADTMEDEPRYLPHVYTEEGACERAESLSPLSFIDHELGPD